MTIIGKNRRALQMALLELICRGGKDMDLAGEAWHTLERNRWDMDCVSPAVHAIVKRAFSLPPRSAVVQRKSHGRTG